jgi:hypothetical protein
LGNRTWRPTIFISGMAFSGQRAASRNCGTRSQPAKKRPPSIRHPPGIGRTGFGVHGDRQLQLLEFRLQTSSAPGCCERALVLISCCPRPTLPRQRCTETPRATYMCRTSALSTCGLPATAHHAGQCVEQRNLKVVSPAECVGAGPALADHCRQSRLGPVEPWSS